MKILHIVPTYFPAHGIGGPIVSVHLLNKWLVKRGVDVTVYTTNFGIKENISLCKEVLVDGVKVWYFPITWKFWQYSSAMRRALRDTIKNFDIVHITSVFLSASTLGAYYARENNKPYIISPRGSLMKETIKHHGIKKRLYLQLLEKRNLKNASAIHFTLRVERDEYLALGLSCKKVIVVPNGIEIGDGVGGGRGEGEKEFKKKYGIKENANVVLFLGRISWKKGFNTLIPAFARVKQNIPNVVLVIAGGDEEGYGTKVKSQISNLKINDKVIFTGMLLGEDKKAAFAAANVFVLPSYAENFGIAVLEAIVAGVPVVVTKEVGLSTYIEESNAGLVVEKNEVAVADGICRILNDRQMTYDLTKNGVDLAKRFLAEAVAGDMLEQYEELLRGRVV